MKANEIRCGNHVINSLLSNLDGIIAADSDVIVFVERFPEQDTYLPVPITEEYLTNFGFTECKTKGEFEYMFVVDNDDVYRLYIFPFDENWVMQLYNHYDAENREYYERVALPTPIKYVHQLQNLYYALAGEELMLVNKI